MIYIASESDYANLIDSFEIYNDSFFDILNLFFLDESSPLYGKMSSREYFFADQSFKWRKTAYHNDDYIHDVFKFFSKKLLSTHPNYNVELDVLDRLEHNFKTIFKNDVSKINSSIYNDSHLFIDNNQYYYARLQNMTCGIAYIFALKACFPDLFLIDNDEQLEVFEKFKKQCSKDISFFNYNSYNIDISLLSIGLRRLLKENEYIKNSFIDSIKSSLAKIKICTTKDGINNFIKNNEPISNLVLILLLTKFNNYSDLQIKLINRIYVDLSDIFTTSEIDLIEKYLTKFKLTVYKPYLLLNKYYFDKVIDKVTAKYNIGIMSTLVVLNRINDLKTYFNKLNAREKKIILDEKVFKEIDFDINEKSSQIAQINKLLFNPYGVSASNIPRVSVGNLFRIINILDDESYEIFKKQILPSWLDTFFNGSIGYYVGDEVDVLGIYSDTRYLEIINEMIKYTNNNKTSRRIKSNLLNLEKITKQGQLKQYRELIKNPDTFSTNVKKVLFKEDIFKS